MNSQKIKIDITKNGKVQIKRHGKTNDSQLSVVGSFTYAGAIGRSADILNVVALSACNAEKLKGASLTLLNRTTGMFVDVVVKKADIGDDEIKMTNFVAECLDLTDFTAADASLLLLANETLTISDVSMQKIDNIKNDYIVVSKQDYDKICSIMAGFNLLSLTNDYCGEEIVVKRTHIKTDNKLRTGEILLNRKQRSFLGIQTPLYLSANLYDKLKKATMHNEEERELFCRGYDPETGMLVKNLPYDVTMSLKKLVQKYLPVKLTLRPVIQSFNYSQCRFLSRFSDFFVGKSTMSLVCRRPYDTDEGADVVRMSKSNMQLLGIDSMERVIIRHKNKSMAVSVLEIDDKDMFFKENLPISINNAIGIPAHIRKKLQITKLDIAVKVDRDTGFIFRKSINEQIVPILLTLFSVNVFRDKDVWKSVLLSLLAVPIVVYFNLSSKRNKRGTK